MSDNEWKDAFSDVLRWARRNARHFAKKAKTVRDGSQSHAAFVGAAEAFNAAVRTMRDMAKTAKLDNNERRPAKRRAAK